MGKQLTAKRLCTTAASFQIPGLSHDFKIRIENMVNSGGFAWIEFMVVAVVRSLVLVLRLFILVSVGFFSLIQQ